MKDFKLKDVLRSDNFEGIYDIMLHMEKLKKNNKVQEEELIEKCIRNYIKTNIVSIIERLNTIPKTSKDGKAMLTFINCTCNFFKDQTYCYKLVELTRKFKGIYYIC